MKAQVSALLQRLSHAMPLSQSTQKASTVAHSTPRETNQTIARQETPPARVRAQKPVWESSAPEEPRRYNIPSDIPAVVGKVVRVTEDLLSIADGELLLMIRLQGVIFTSDPGLRALAHNRLQSLIGSQVLAAGYQGTSGIDIVARIMDGEVDVNHQLLLAGLARYDEADARTLSQRDRVLYAQAERQARAARQGMWRNGRR